MTGKRLGVIAVVGNEDVVAAVAVEVGDHNLSTVLRSRDRADEERTAVSKPTAPVAQEHPDRKGRVGDREGESRYDEISDAVRVTSPVSCSVAPPTATAVATIVGAPKSGVTAALCAAGAKTTRPAIGGKIQRITRRRYALALKKHSMWTRSS